MRIFGTAPTLDDIADIAERALAGLPWAFAQHVEGVAIQVQEAADAATLDSLGLESPWDLTGLYAGVPFGQRSTMDPPHTPDVIMIYRQAVLLEWIETGEDLDRLVRSVLVHEIAHHFGFSDEQIEDIEGEG